MVDFSASLLSVSVRLYTPVVVLEVPNPLFVVGVGTDTPWDTMLEELRLSGVPSASDAQAIIRRAMLDVRLGFYRSLQVRRINYLLAIEYNAEPVNDDGVLRALAASTEILWTKMLLMRRMRSAFIDGNGVQQILNDEAGITETPDTFLDAEITRIQNEITNNLELLAGSEEIGSETSIQVTTFEPSTAPPNIGATVWPSLR